MSTFRRRFRVVVDGVPHDIVTNARDMANIEVDPTAPGGLRGADMTFRLIHAALMRLGVAGIPTDYDAFVDVLDDLDDLDGIPVGVPAVSDDGAAPVDPTQLVDSAG